MAVMRADLTLKQKQSFRETPRNLALIIGAVAAFTAAFAGLIGFKLGQRESAGRIILRLPQGTTISIPTPQAMP